MARDKPTTSSLTSSFFLSSLGSTWESHGGISYHSWMAKQESLTTTYFLHTLLPCDLISTLVDCKLHHFAVSSSIIVKPPHAPPNCSKTPCPQENWQPNNSRPSFLCMDLSNNFFLKILCPSYRTLFALKTFSNSNRMRGPPNNA